MVSKVTPTDHIAAQHHLLVIDLNIRYPKKTKPKTDTQRIKWWKLKEHKDSLLPSLLSCLIGSTDAVIEELWTSTVNASKASVVDVLGRTSPDRPKIDKATWWWNEEVQATISEKKAKYKRWMGTHLKEDRNAYLVAKREAKKAVAIAKSELYDMLDTREGEKSLYRLAKARHRSSTMDSRHMSTVKAADGNILRGLTDPLERWRQYFFQMFNDEFPYPPIPLAVSVQGPVLPITPAEVHEALGKMKPNKATGPDDVAAEIWKLMGGPGAVWLASFFTRIVAEGQTWNDWQTSTTIPIWKQKGLGDLLL